MANYESYQLRRGKYARLDAPADDDIDTPTRTRFSDDSHGTLEDLEEYDPLAFDRRLQRKKSAGDLKIRKASFRAPEATRTRSWTPGRWCCWLLTFVTAVVLLLGTGGIWAWKVSVPLDGQSPPWYPTPKGGADPAWEESYKKAAELVAQMTLVEKVNVTTGTGWSMDMCVGNNGAVPRLGFPQLCLQDGPLGIRFADNITAFPAGITVGATWNKELMYQRGKAHGKEARLKGVNVLLGPAMGPFGRMPAGGRNWEGFGSDPVLQGIAAAQTIKGIQDEGVMATAKHYVANEQEHFRQAWEWGIPNAISSNIDDRTLHEIYVWPFADSVRAGVTSVMCSYNQVNSSYACQNSKLLNGILKDELGFQGFVQSDWLAQRAGVASAEAGLDMTMPGDGLRWAKGDSLWGAELTRSVLNGSVLVERLDDMVTRIVASWYQVGQDKWENEGPNFSSWTNDRIGKLHEGSPSDETTGVVNQHINVQGEGKDFHGNLVRQIAAEGTVMVKNEGDLLPLSRKGRKDGQAVAGQTKYRVGVFGEDARLPRDGINKCPDQSCNEGTLASGWGSGAVDYPYLIEPMSAIRSAFDNGSVFVTDWLENKLPKQKEIVQDQDLCIVFVNSDAGEGYLKWEDVRGDRNDLELQKGGNELIKDVAAGCGKGNGDVVVVVHTVGPVILEKFIETPNVKAVLIANLPGQESGNAIVDVLFGDVNPSGRLPFTIAKKEADYGPGSKVKYFPTPGDGLAPQQNFSEGLYVDYRYFDKQSIAPRYEFGYGLSYSKFELSSLDVRSKTKKTPLPASRPSGLAPPTYSTEIPDAKSALFPEGFHKVEKYIYPWLDSTSGVNPPKTPASQPQSPLSDAGGGPGGNPDLYTPVVTVGVSISNMGPVDGSSVVQVYITFPQNYTDPETGEPVDFPVRVLRGFEKVFVAAQKQKDGKGGEGKDIEFELTRKDLSYWDVRRQNWVMPTTGEFGIEVGFSSRDLRLKGTW
ncbi:glycoside hydrolase family 3 protein [Dothidotthia symphoricarpi CBS 119687]|uniref:Probable beta-glucosidase E n=1 Tax=Dothidotthia symphoricarpi CBS 119687 TaxID=1392245 RepID=A0A6A6AIV1_9PLEO|nr:glycoside hydrolase family 3 protein [Dothidotthia symphoricarpi CBS 119687]KAF2130834.1 glycoside hydrolase family 3 protein [Dothidotthia symphoricarpi CBS 119687]